ncbi:hypothetical protein PCANC_20027 [Puccinia coronata f. sp. avenae]|uniref:Uncharacterized protein n=1 Tax=Puccinia coronata f. sp. avenae TaxID=200324 RepID=A0A2N5S9C9_9BASI|nr:hypothetical protein PCANC_20027 [Puccinia coronata f. sp. avenae]
MGRVGPWATCNPDPRPAGSRVGSGHHQGLKPGDPTRPNYSAGRVWAHLLLAGRPDGPIALRPEPCFHTRTSKRQPQPPSSPSNQGEESSSAKEKTDAVTSEPQTPKSPLPPHNSHSSNSDLEITAFVEKKKNTDPASLTSKPNKNAKTANDNKNELSVGQTNKKRKTTSHVWEHFHRKETEHPHWAG